MAPATSSAQAKTSPPEKCEINKKGEKKEKEKEKKPVNEIEEIFRAAKKKRKDPPPPPLSSSAEKKANKKSPNKKKIKKESKNSGEEGSLRKRRKTADGLSIYSAEELGVGNPNAGGTALCPFDCSCCY